MGEKILKQQCGAPHRETSRDSRISSRRDGRPRLHVVPIRAMFKLLNLMFHHFAR